MIDAKFSWIPRPDGKGKTSVSVYARESDGHLRCVRQVETKLDPGKLGLAWNASGTVDQFLNSVEHKPMPTKEGALDGGVIDHGSAKGG